MNRESSKWIPPLVKPDPQAHKPSTVQRIRNNNMLQVGTILKLKYSEVPILVIVTKLRINGVEGVIITNRERTCRSIMIVYLENYMYFDIETQNWMGFM